MKKYIFTLFLMLVLAPCANATALLFTHTTHPISATPMPLCCNSCCLKEGKAMSLNILYLFEFGDAGVDTAAKLGCINQIYYVNQTETSFLLLFKKLTTTVYGK